MNVKLKHTILFNKILVIEYIDKTVVGFSCKKEYLEKIKDKLEKIGQIQIEYFDIFVNVEIQTTQDKVTKILKILKEIPLLDLGVDASNLNF